MRAAVENKPANSGKEADQTPLRRCGARMQDFKRGAEALGKTEGRRGTSLARAVLGDGQEDPDKLHDDVTASAQRTISGPRPGP